MRAIRRDWEDLSDMPVRSLNQPQQVLTVRIVPHRLCETPDMLRIDVTHAERNLFGTRNFEPLSRLEHVHESRGFHKRFVRPCVEPGGAAAKDLDGEFA